mmetsp:Transcript_20773/g.65024  ORF Transcript_20773/g.65024 Transcript_20773/m.65024 type:complete len:265 (-) Transcript_20773:35-829(-)
MPWRRMVGDAWRGMERHEKAWPCGSVNQASRLPPAAGSLLVDEAERADGDEPLAGLEAADVRQLGAAEVDRDREDAVAWPNSDLDEVRLDEVLDLADELLDLVEAALDLAIPILVEGRAVLLLLFLFAGEVAEDRILDEPLTRRASGDFLPRALHHLLLRLHPADGDPGDAHAEGVDLEAQHALAGLAVLASVLGLLRRALILSDVEREEVLVDRVRQAFEAVGDGVRPVVMLGLRGLRVALLLALRQVCLRRLGADGLLWGHL